MSLDRRLNAFREDLADARLEGRIEARRFVEGWLKEIRAAVAPLRRRPDADAPLETQALFGERARVFEEADGWAWAQLETDGYVGYLPSAAIGDVREEADHKVSALATFVYPAADIKRPPVMRLSFGARLAVTGEDGAFVEIAPFGFVWRGHVAPVEAYEADFVAVAERFVGVPYLWGGRSVEGVDCSGLVQLALAAVGLAVLRDSDLQETVGEPVQMEGLKRGDLVFWPGHVGIVRDEFSLLHANGYHMAACVEALDEAVERILKTGSVIRTMRKIDRA